MSKGEVGKGSRAASQEFNARLRNLRWWNIGVGLVLAVQAIVIAVLANDFRLPVTATYMTGPPGSDQELTQIGSIPLAWGVFAFMAISAAALLLIASPGVFSWYKRNLGQDRNYGRWMEYSISSSLMIVLITMICGITDIAAMLAIFGVNAAMIFFGWLMEKYESPGKPSWLSYWFGSFAGIIPWIAIVVYLWSPGVEGGASPPGFVWGILGVVLRLLHELRGEHGAAVQAGGPLARLPLRREGLHPPQPDVEVTAHLAGVRQHSDRVGDRRSATLSGTGPAATAR